MIPVPTAGEAPAVVLFGEARFARDPATGAFHPEDSGAATIAWARYQQAIPGFELAMRTRTLPAGRPGEIFQGAVSPLPYYQGLTGAVRRLPAVVRAVDRRVASADVVIARLPGVIGTIAALSARRRGVPYAVELVGDVADVIDSGAVGRAVQPLVAMLAGVTRRAVHGAAASRFVTIRTLQDRYPPAPGRPTFALSSVSLPPAAFVASRVEPPATGAFRLLAVGSQETGYKRHDLAIEALAALRRQGVDCSLTLIGQGAAQSGLRQLVVDRDLDGAVTFLAPVGDAAAVRDHIDRAHLLLHPSDTEGLPRVVIEAMARGVPVVATAVGGVPELLPAEQLVPRGDATALAAAARRLLTDQARRAAASRRAISTAETFADSRTEADYAEWFAALAALAPGHRPRVVHVLGSLNRGGAETVTLQLVEQLADEVDSTILTLSAPPGTLTFVARAAGAVVQSCPLTPRATFPFRLYRALRRLRPDVVVSHVSLTSALVLSVAAAARAPRRIARMHSAGDGRPATPARRAYRGVSRRLLRRVATEILAVSQSALDFGTGTSSPLGKAMVMSNGVDLDRFVIRPRPRSVGAHRLTVVHVGRNAPEKNRRVLPALQAALAADDPAWRMWIAGAGGDSDMSLDEAVLAAGDLVLLGERPDIEEVIGAADVLVLPSVREGLPGVVLEALACGVPAVCSDLPSLRELAARLPGITLVPTAAPAAIWASAVRAAAESHPAPDPGLRIAVGDNRLDAVSATAAWRPLLGLPAQPAVGPLGVPPVSAAGE